MSETPRQAWDAAVARQHVMVAEIATLPLDEAGGRRFVELVNAATRELFAAGRELAMLDPPLQLTMDEWLAVYNLHVRAMFDHERRLLLHRVEQQRDSMASMWRRVKPWL